jgi:membrane protease YdiL (CAAX protease family)
MTAATGAYVIGAAARLLSSERLIVPASVEGACGQGVPRPGQVAVWFAVMWAIVLIVSINAGPDFDIRGQLLINLGLVFLGGSVVFVRYYGLDPWQLLSLRWPHPAVWMAVVPGIPAGLITGLGIFRLSELVTPVPRQVLESFNQYVLPDGVPFWQLLVLMSILPGICEEIAFRGALLGSLRRHLRAPVAVLVVGVAFGFFHFSLFRIFQTAYLGVLLGATTVFTGSLYPAIVWHAGSNALALCAAHFGLGIGTLEPTTYVAAVGILVVCFWILWRTRVSSSSRGSAPE